MKTTATMVSYYCPQCLVLSMVLLQLTASLPTISLGKEKTISHIKDTLFSAFCRLVLVATQLEINLSSDLTLFEFILG